MLQQREIEQTRGVTASHRNPFAAALLGAAILAPTLMACAQQPPPAPPPGIRVRGATLAEWDDLGAFSRRAAQACGTAVRDAAGISPRGFTLTLICADTAACERALTQLARATDFVSEAVPDRRMTIPRPIVPNAPQAR